MRTSRLLPLLLLGSLIFVQSVFAQTKGGGKGAFANIDWNKPFPPHKVIGNVYSVGSEELGSF